MVLTFIPLPHLRLERQVVGGEDCHNRLSALALSEVGEDPCGLMRIENTSSATTPDAALRPKGKAAAG